jgi:hypothetical protein
MQKGAAYWMDLHYFDKEDPFFLAQVQKGITNFTKILTGKNIPVEYATQGDSMTDGKKIYIGSNIKKSTIDYTIGLALHEASHILLSDFVFIKKFLSLVIANKVDKNDKDILFTLMNFIEDKRIDNFIYVNAPGYQYYYEELYNKSFFNSEIDKGLISDAFSIPTWDAYMFRIINILNPNSDENKLPGLKQVKDIIDIQNINRLNSTEDSFKVALEIYRCIKPHILSPDEAPKKSSKEFKIKEKVNKQEKFINGEYTKGKISKSVKEQVNQLSSALNLNNPNINGKSYSLVVTNSWEDYFFNEKNAIIGSENIKKGFSMGKKLLTKLSARDVIKQDIFENQKNGKLDSRKLFKSSFNEDIFLKIEKEIYKNIFIHISLDLSASMKGNKINKTIQTTIALAYVACHLNNFDVEISLRGTDTPHDFNKAKSVLAYAFNSKHHNINQLKRLKYIYPQGQTPEGICLEEVRKHLPRNSYNQDVYLLNISDGMPNVGGYYYDDTSVSRLIDYTRDTVNKIKKDGVNVLSYFISDSKNLPESPKDFQKMYGKHAAFISVDNINEVSKTINKLLLSNTLKVF